MEKTYGKMVSRIVFFFLYFATCGLLEAISSPSQSRNQDTPKKDNDGVRLDAIADPEEEQSCDITNNQSRKSRRRKNYDVNKQVNAKQTRCGWKLRRNKVAPVHLPTIPHKDDGDKYIVNGEDHSKTEERKNGGDEGSSSANENIPLDFYRTKDSFSARKNSALALQSFAVCARVNANFMRAAPALVPNEAGEENLGECSSGSKETGPPRKSIGSKISMGFHTLRKRVLKLREPTRDKESSLSGQEVKRQVTEDSLSSGENVRQKMKGIRNVFRAGKSNKGAGAIQKFNENDFATFDRDLYVNTNKMTVSYDAGQSVSLDPFIVQEHEPAISEVPITYLTVNMGDNPQGSLNDKKSRLKGLLTRFKLTKRSGHKHYA